MQSRSIIWMGVFIGSTIGSLIPGLWGDGMFSYSSVLLDGAGALVGLWIGFKMSTRRVPIPGGSGLLSRRSPMQKQRSL